MNPDITSVNWSLRIDDVGFLDCPNRSHTNTHTSQEGKWHCCLCHTDTVSHWHLHCRWTPQKYSKGRGHKGKCVELNFVLQINTRIKIPITVYIRNAGHDGVSLNIKRRYKPGWSGVCSWMVMGAYNGTQDASVIFISGYKSRSLWSVCFCSCWGWR